jgi:hypothetical protein
LDFGLGPVANRLAFDPASSRAASPPYLLGHAMTA